MAILGTNNAKRPVMSDPRYGMRMRALDSEAMDLAKMVMETWKQNCVYHPIKLLFQQCGKIVIPWESPLSMYYSWESKGLDPAQIVLDIQYQLKITAFIIPNNFCFNNIAKKSFPGTPLGQVPDLAVRGAWTSPRWSWTSRKNLKQLFLSSPTTFVSTTLPKSHSLGLPLVRSQTLQSEVPGPHPDGHGHPETTSNICFYYPNNFCFNNIAKKPFPGTPLGHVPDLAVRGAWTSPRWSWTSGNNLQQLL